MKIGCGSAFDDERLDWPLELAESGLVSYLGFDCIGERQVAAAHVQRRAEPTRGYNKRLPDIVEQFGPYIARGLRVVGNFGVANPEAAGEVVVDAFRKMGLTGVRVGVITGDSVLKQAVAADVELVERGCRISEVAEPVVAADAYSGAAEIVALLEEGVQFVIGGRQADSSLFVGPIVHENGWSLDDWPKVALACVAGHLCECSLQVTGGNYIDPPYQTVSDPYHPGMPIAEVEGDQVVITKLPGTGGVVNERTVKLQLGFEVHDPSAYLTPDVSADFSGAVIDEIGPDRVRVRGITGRPRPERLKVLVALDLGWRAVSEISFGGPGCLDRARAAADILRRRVEPIGSDIVDVRTDYIGYDSLYQGAILPGDLVEVRLRCAARCATESAGRAFLQEVRHLIMAVAAPTGFSPAMLEPFIGVTPAFLPRKTVMMHWEVMTS